MIDEMRFFDNATTTGESKVFGNTKGGVLTLQISGSATAFSFSLLGCLNIESEEFVELQGINMHNFSLDTAITTPGIYEFDISGIRQLKVTLNSIEGGDITIMGISKEG